MPLERHLEELRCIFKYTFAQDILAALKILLIVWEMDKGNLWKPLYYFLEIMQNIYKIV